MLLTNGAHLGDVIVTMVVLPEIRRLIPHARIGMLVGSWPKAIVARQPDVKWLHDVDHRRHRPASIPLIKHGNYFVLDTHEVVNQCLLSVKIAYDLLLGVSKVYEKTSRRNADAVDSKKLLNRAMVLPTLNFD